MCRLRLAAADDSDSETCESASESDIDDECSTSEDEYDLDEPDNLPPKPVKGQKRRQTKGSARNIQQKQKRCRQSESPKSVKSTPQQ